jgi:16S rRNA (cytosine1407-C5)-methyltransferase
VLWCKEGFFIERENITAALGKDLLHQLGYFYIQEASSMLPPVLLSPKPGELVLDMSAAPGSKTTQMAAMMNSKGCIIANDVQPKRLKTLQSACYRQGATNVVLMQKQGQWYGQQMAERFDRVLCDAPCSALGTVRKDPDAIHLSTVHTVSSLAKVQLELLDSACKAVKIEGTIVYSTCTLTVEENEAIVESVLQKYPGAFKLITPKTIWANIAVRESKSVQAALGSSIGPMIRLWPHTFNTEGFFCAVLYKIKSICQVPRILPVRRREQTLTRAQVRACTHNISERFGTNFIRINELLSEWEGMLYLTTTYTQECALPNRNYSLGIPYGKLLNTTTVRLRTDVAIIRGEMATSNRVDLTFDECVELLKGKNSSCAPRYTGDVLVLYNGVCLGVCTAIQGVLKNTLDRELISADVRF